VIDIDLQEQELMEAVICRTCPDPDVLFENITDMDKEILDMHLQRCKTCRDNLNAGPCDAQRKDQPLPEKISPAIGQVWRLKKHLSGWEENGWYCNAPAVLILELPGLQRNKTKVAQIHSFELLQAENDIKLDTSDNLTWFAETWNIYKLEVDDLDKCLSETNLSQMPTILKAVDDNKQEAAMNNYVNKFELLEDEIGKLVVSRSIYKKFQENRISLLDRISLALQCIGKSFEDEVKKLTPNWLFPNGLPDFARTLLPTEQTVPLSATKEALDNEDSISDRLLSFFGQAKPCSDNYAFAMGAKSSSELLFPANYLKLTSSGLELSQTIVKLDPPGWDERGLVIICKVVDVIADDVKAWWIIEGSEPLPATELKFYENKTIKVIFAGLDEQQQNKIDASLKLLLISGYE